MSGAGIMDQSAILASEAGKLTVTTCLQPSVRAVAPPWPIGPGTRAEWQTLAFAFCLHLVKIVSPCC